MGGLISFGLISCACMQVPQLNQFPEEHSVVIMDNCRIHNKEELSQMTVAATGLEVMFLPPYTPQFNPIESMFSTYKQWLRSNRDLVRQVDALDAIDMAFDSITAANCEAWVRSVAFYDVD